MTPLLLDIRAAQGSPFWRSEPKRILFYPHGKESPEKVFKPLTPLSESQSPHLESGYQSHMFEKNENFVVRTTLWDL